MTKETKDKIIDALWPLWGLGIVFSLSFAAIPMAIFLIPKEVTLDVPIVVISNCIAWTIISIICFVKVGRGVV
jgi:hypothetical protein